MAKIASEVVLSVLEASECYEIAKDPDLMEELEGLARLDLGLWHTVVSQILAGCPKEDCRCCGQIACAYSDPKHYQEDECPSCGL